MPILKRIPLVVALGILIAPPGLAQGSGGRRRGMQGRMRFNFERLASRSDLNGDGKITPEEFRGPPMMFDRMDSNGDGVLTAEDFPPGGTPRQRPQRNALRGLMRILDGDHDGKVTKEELGKFFDRADTDQSSSLSENELREAFRPARGGGGMPRFQDFPAAQPAPGQMAPDFELRDPEGRTVSLSKLLETKPVVLEFGSFT